VTCLHIVHVGVWAHVRGLMLPYLSSMQSACAILSSVASLAPPYFSTYHKRQDFRKKKKKGVGHKMCVFIFSTTFIETFLILR
jgi:hypothetical protein